MPTVDLLLGRADAVFIDVTDLREHVVWEIQRAQGLGAATRTLYLLDASADMDQTTARLASLLPNQVDRAHVFAYDSHGLRERDRFRSLLVDTLTSADRPRPADRSMTMSVIATILFVITVIPLIILLRPLLDVPLGMPEQLRLAHWPEVVDPAAKATIALGLLTLLLLAIAARANGPIRFLLVVQILLLLGAAAGLLQF